MVNETYMTMKLKNVIAVIPAHNENKHIAKVVTQTKKYVDKVIVVDDGSSDSTARIASEIGAKVISNPYNIGYGASLKAGLRRALGEFIVIIDSDGQLQLQNMIRRRITGTVNIVTSAAGKRFQIMCPRASSEGLAVIIKIRFQLMRQACNCLSSELKDFTVLQG